MLNQHMHTIMSEYVCYVVNHMFILNVTISKTFNIQFCHHKTNNGADMGSFVSDAV